MRSEAVVNELVRGRRPLQRLVNTIALLAPAFVWVMVAALALTSVIGVIILAVDDADVASFIIRNDINGAIRIELLRAISLTPPLTALAAFLLVLITQSKRRVDQLVWLSKLVSPLVVAYPVRTLCEYSVWADRQLEFLCWLALTGFIFERLMRSSLEALEVFSEPVAPVIARVRGLRVFEYLPLLLVILGAAAFALFVGYFTFQQHHRIQTAGYDLGIYDNLMFNALHGHPYRSPVLWGSAGGNYVANHAELAQILFVPFYALRPGPEALLTIQAVMMGGSAIPLYFLARTTLSKLSASAITFCWLIGAALISPLFYDFHWLPIAVPFHLTLMYALVTRRWKLAVFAFLMAVLIREDVGLIIAIGSTIFITTKWNVRLGVGLMVTSIIWFLGIKFVLMPSLGKWNFEGLYAGLTALFNALFGIASAGEGEKVSYDAPAVSGVNQDGATVNFADVYKKGPTVVFFYPKADTPGCTKQACSLGDAFAELSKQNVQVLGVSFDKPEAQKKFKDKFTLPYDLIADPEGKIVAAFKVEKMVKGLLNLAKRSCFLVKDGKVIWQDYQASTDQQAADIKRVLGGAK